MEQLVKALNIMGVLHTVQVVQHQAKFVITVFRQGFAALAGGGVIVKVRAEPGVCCEHQVLSIEIEARTRCRQDKIGQGLQRDQVKPVLPNQIDAVVSQREHHLMTVPGEGALVKLLQSSRLSLFIEYCDSGHIKQRGAGRVLAEQVIVHEVNGVPVKVKNHGCAVIVGIFCWVLTDIGYDGAVRLQRKAEAFFRTAEYEVIEQGQEVIGLDIGQVRCTVQEAELYIHPEADAVVIDGKRGAGDLMRVRRKSRDAEGQEHRQYQEYAEQFLHVGLPCSPCGSMK